MRNLFLIVCLLTSQLQAQRNPTMRINFGASSSFFKINAAYFYTPTIKIIANQENPETTPVYTYKNNTLASMRFGIETMVMLNNRSNYTESFRKNAPRFIHYKMGLDGVDGQLYNSLSLAQGIPCMSRIPFFGQIKGYWSVGSTYNTSVNPELASRPYDKRIGARAGFNCYNKTSALQSEVVGFKDRVVVNVIVYKKIGEHIMLHSGVEYNKPLAGVSLLAGSCRFSINTRLYKNQLQHGISFTGNL